MAQCVAALMLDWIPRDLFANSSYAVCEARLPTPIIGEAKGI